MFCIAEFGGVGQSKEIAVIHRNWILGRKCFWPPYWRNTQQLLRGLKNGDQPDPSTWNIYDIRIIGDKYFETYEMARRALSGAQICSDLSADETAEGLRKRVQPEQDAGSDSSNESPLKEPVTPKTQKPRTKKMRKGTGAGLSTPPSFPRDLEIFTVPNPTLVAVRTDPDEETSRSHLQKETLETTSIVEIVASPFQGQNTPLQTPLIMQPSSSIFGETLGETVSSSLSTAPSSTQTTSIVLAPPQVTHQSVPIPMSAAPPSANLRTENLAASIHTRSSNLPQIIIGTETPPSELTGSMDILKAIQTNQQLLLAKADITIDLLTTILGGRKAARNVEETNTCLSLPFVDKSSFTKFDERMKSDTAVRENLITILETTGGNNANQVVYRVMTELMTDELMVQFTFKGYTGKQGFKDTLIYTCVLEAVKRQQKSQGLTKQEVEKAVDYWLRKASNRIETRKKKANKGENAINSNESTD